MVEAGSHKHQGNLPVPLPDFSGGSNAGSPLHMSDPTSSLLSSVKLMNVLIFSSTRGPANRCGIFLISHEAVFSTDHAFIISLRVAEQDALKFHAVPYRKVVDVTLSGCSPATEQAVDFSQRPAFYTPTQCPDAALWKAASQSSMSRAPAAKSA